jgi:sulfite exporter TauE/SafE
MELWTAFLLGLAGSLHCGAMCGPLVLAMARAKPRTLRESTGRVFYHLGRVASYCVLGFSLGLVGQAAGPLGFQRGLSIALGVALLAGVLLATKLRLAAPVWKWVTWLKGNLRGLLLQRSTIGSQAVMGALNGLLPCGLVYVAAAGATATGHAAMGAAYMALFGLGTWPVMLGIHLAGQRLPVLSRLSLANVTRAAVLLMGVLLILRGLELGIPYVSPEISVASDGNASCH